jgi:hypothetical protein
MLIYEKKRTKLPTLTTILAPIYYDYRNHTKEDKVLLLLQEFIIAQTHIILASPLSFACKNCDVSNGPKDPVRKGEG